MGLPSINRKIGKFKLRTSDFFLLQLLTILRLEFEPTANYRIAVLLKLQTCAVIGWKMNSRKLKFMLHTLKVVQLYTGRKHIFHVCNQLSKEKSRNLMIETKRHDSCLLLSWINIWFERTYSSQKSQACSNRVWKGFSKATLAFLYSHSNCEHMV